MNFSSRKSIPGVICIVLSCWAQNALADQKAEIASAGARLYAKPQPGKALGELNGGTKVTASDQATSHYYRVTTGGHSGWVNEKSIILSHEHVPDANPEPVSKASETPKPAKKAKVIEAAHVEEPVASETSQANSKTPSDSGLYLGAYGGIGFAGSAAASFGGEVGYRLKRWAVGAHFNRVGLSNVDSSLGVPTGASLLTFTLGLDYQVTPKFYAGARVGLSSASASGSVQANGSTGAVGALCAGYTLVTFHKLSFGLLADGYLLLGGTSGTALDVLAALKFSF